MIPHFQVEVPIVIFRLISHRYPVVCFYWLRCSNRLALSSHAYYSAHLSYRRATLEQLFHQSFDFVFLAADIELIVIRSEGKAKFRFADENLIDHRLSAFLFSFFLSFVVTMRVNDRF